MIIILLSKRSFSSLTVNMLEFLHYVRVIFLWEGNVHMYMMSGTPVLRHPLYHCESGLYICSCQVLLVAYAKWNSNLYLQLKGSSQQQTVLVELDRCYACEMINL